MIAQGDIMRGQGPASGAGGTQGAHPGKPPGADPAPKAAESPATDKMKADEDSAGAETSAFAALVAPAPPSAKEPAETAPPRVASGRPALSVGVAATPAPGTRQAAGATDGITDGASDALTATHPDEDEQEAPVAPKLGERPVAKHIAATATTDESAATRRKTTPATQSSDTATPPPARAKAGAQVANEAAAAESTRSTAAPEAAAPARPTAMRSDGAEAAIAPPQNKTEKRGAPIEGGRAPRNDDDADIALAPRENSRTSSAAQPPQSVAAVSTISGEASPLATVDVARPFGGAEGVGGGPQAATPGRAELSLAAATPAGHAPQPAPQGERAAAQISAQISFGAARAGGGDRVEIRLDPPELGRVHLSFAMDRDGVVAVVSADRPEIVDLMRRHGDILQRDLTAAGYRNVTLDFARSGTGGGDQRGGQRDPTPAGASFGAPDRGDDGPAVAALWRGAPDDRLDIRL